MDEIEKHKNIEYVSPEEFDAEPSVRIIRVKVSVDSALGRKIEDRLKRGYELKDTVLRNMELLYQMIPYSGKCLDDQYIYGCSGFEYKNGTITKPSPDYTWKYVEYEGCTPRFASNDTLLSRLWKVLVRNRVSFKDLVSEIGLDTSVCRMSEIFYYTANHSQNDKGSFYISMSYKKEDFTEQISLLNNGVKEIPFSEYDKCLNDIQRFGSAFNPIYMREIFFNHSTPKEVLERLYNSENLED